MEEQQRNRPVSIVLTQADCRILAQACNVVATEHGTRIPGQVFERIMELSQFLHEVNANPLAYPVAGAQKKKLIRAARKTAKVPPEERAHAEALGEEVGKLEAERREQFGVAIPIPEEDDETDS